MYTHCDDAILTVAMSRNETMGHMPHKCDSFAHSPFATPSSGHAGFAPSDVHGSFRAINAVLVRCPKNVFRAGRLVSWRQPHGPSQRRKGWATGPRRVGESFLRLPELADPSTPSPHRRLRPHLDHVGLRMNFKQQSPSTGCYPWRKSGCPCHVHSPWMGRTKPPNSLRDSWHLVTLVGTRSSQVKGRTGLRETPPPDHPCAFVAPAGSRFCGVIVVRSVRRTSTPAIMAWSWRHWRNGVLTL